MKVLQKSFWILSLILPAAAQNGAWESVQALTPGTDVQVRLTSGESARGPLGLVSDRSVALTLKNGQRMFARQEIARLSVKMPGHRKRNALIGLAVGTGGGIAAGAAMDAGEHPCIVACDLGKVVFTPMGAIVGVIVGALLPTGRWSTIYETR
jgi:hypothetical protein